MTVREGIAIQHETPYVAHAARPLHVVLRVIPAR